jgi:hypothetical protein
MANILHGLMAPSKLQICRTQLNQRRTGKSSWSWFCSIAMEIPWKLLWICPTEMASLGYPLCIDGDLKNSWKPHGIVPIMNMGLSENSGENRRTTWWISIFINFYYENGPISSAHPSLRRHMLRSRHSRKCKMDRTVCDADLESLDHRGWWLLRELYYPLLPNISQ